ncbi:hypothetical protein OG563_22220 [Nocardia vinacea]|uniref:Secreted protein n=1 Tax=Nocardia vinacea TaxID=96468 RepID=A0ABZ1Z9R3_9NOCA|nr:hypothetical protein [Nocardia vinacea]
MAISRKIATASVAVAALAAALVGTQQAAADPIAGGCSGGQFSYNTSPLGMSVAPTTATWIANLTGCTGAPASEATVSGTFSGNGSCNGADGQIDGKVNWSNGVVSRISGPWHVPGGVARSMSNTVTITDGPGAGGQLVVEQGPIGNAVAMAGSCIAGNLRNADVPILAVRFN